MSRSAAQIISRVAAGVLGGYVFTWGFVTSSIASLVVAGMPYGEALTVIYLLAFFVLLTAFCWSFVAASVGRVWLVLAGGGAVMTAAAWAMSRPVL